VEEEVREGEASEEEVSEGMASDEEAKEGAAPDKEVEEEVVGRDPEGEAEDVLLQVPLETHTPGLPTSSPPILSFSQIRCFLP
jgi:hypothetical protein